MDCSKLAVIPQYAGTCWFNAILMVSLYSQYTRKAVIKASKNWNKNDSFLMILKEILKIYNKEPEKVEKLFYKIKPEKILLKMIKKYNEKNLIKQFKIDFKKDGYKSLGYLDNNADYINQFLNYLKVNVLDITYNNENNKCLINFNKYHSYNFFKNKINALKKNKNIINKTKRIIKNIPDILIIQENIYNYEFFNHLYDFPDYPYNSSLYEFNIKGLDKFKNTINLNGYKYKLDSVILDNYNNTVTGHTIAGITCNNEHYVYNGWNKDGNIKFDVNKFRYKNSIPCPLMKFNWNIHKDTKFNLNPDLCKLDFIKNDNKDHCYSFNKGRRTFIYAKISNKKIKNSLSSKSKSNIDLSNMSSIIKNIHNVKNMTKKELLHLFDLMDIIFENENELTDEDLRKAYTNFIKKHYNIKDK
jgi:predicted transcriptional regulator